MTNANPFGESAAVTPATSPEQDNGDFQDLENHRLSHVAETGAFPIRRGRLPVRDPKIIVSDADSDLSQREDDPQTGGPTNVQTAASNTYATSSTSLLQVPSSSSTTMGRSAQDLRFGYRRARKDFAYPDDLDKSMTIPDNYPVPSRRSHFESVGMTDIENGENPPPLRGTRSGIPTQISALDRAAEASMGRKSEKNLLLTITQHPRRRTLNAGTIRRRRET